MGFNTLALIGDGREGAAPTCDTSASADGCCCKAAASTTAELDKLNPGTCGFVTSSAAFAVSSTPVAAVAVGAGGMAAAAEELNP